MLATKRAAAFYIMLVLSTHTQVYAADAADADTDVLQEIVITAERRTADVQATAISLTVLSGDALGQQHIDRLSDLQSQVPDLSITSGGFTENINIRGLGNTTSSPNVTTGVPVFRDGLYQPEAILLSEPFYDIADVEVLRGPQGTIVGQNSTGGALIVNSNNPNFDGNNGYAEVAIGVYGDIRADGAINLPVNDVLSTRLAFNIEQRNSYFNEIGTNLGDARDGATSNPGHINEHNMRLGVLFKPGDAFQALLKAEFNRSDTGGVTGRALPACSICAPNSSFYAFGYAGPSTYNGYSNPGLYTLVYNTPEMQTDRADRYSLELRWTLSGDFVLRSLSGFQYLSEYRVDDTSGSAAPGAMGGTVTYQALAPDKYLSQEFNLISPDMGNLSYLAGVSFFYRGTPLHTGLTQYPADVVPAPGGAGSLLNVSLSSYSRLAGLFGQVDYHLTDKWQLQVGARFSYDDQTTGGTTLIANNTIAVSQAGKYSNSVPSGKIALNYTPTPSQFLYAFYARGFKDGGINTANNSFAPEHVNDYEVGWKSTLWNERLRTQIGAYYMQYDALQQQVLDVSTTQLNVVNLGNSTIEGIEASFQARIERWTLNGGLSYNHSKLGAVNAVVAAYELPNGGAGLPPQCVPGTTVGCFNYQPYEVGLTGEKNPYSPTWTGNISLGYEVIVGDGRLTPRLNYSHVGQQYASIFQNTDYYQLQSRNLIDAFLDYNYKNWDFQAFGRNLTNDVYLAGISGSNGFYGDPRTYGISAMVKF